ncbi:MAG: hypothetical protein H6825_02895 [Planctomycetes bacterium]|nr:hypothetical protein [Planctomycetota bacterium]
MRNLILVVTSGLAGALALGAGAFVATLQQDVPAGARAELERRASGHAIEKVKIEHSDGALVYEARWSDGVHRHEAAVTADGVLVDTEDQVDASDVPAAARAAAAKHMSGQLTFVKQTFVFFEAQSADGNELLLRATGGLVDAEALEGGPENDEHAERGDDEGDEEADEDGEQDDDGEMAVNLRDVPAAILAAANAALPGASFTAASTEMEDGVAHWELSGTVDGEDVEIELLADGTLLEIERD